MAFRRIGQLTLRSFCSAAPKPVTPDFTTSVNVGDIRIGRPKRAATLKDLKAKDTGSLIPETLKDMEVDVEFQVNQENLRKLGQKKLTADEKKKTNACT
jgi:hypothetical protein